MIEIGVTYLKLAKLGAIDPYLDMKQLDAITVSTFKFDGDKFRHRRRG